MNGAFQELMRRPLCDVLTYTCKIQIVAAMHDGYRSQGSSCCFQPISEDLQKRLNRTASQLEQANQTNEQLKQDLSRKMRELDRLKCENYQLDSQRKNAEDHSSILATKADLLKSDLQKSRLSIEQLELENSNLKSQNSILSSVLQEKRSKLRQFKAALSNAQFTESQLESVSFENQEQKTEIRKLEMIIGEKDTSMAALKEQLQIAKKKLAEASRNASLMEQYKTDLEFKENELRALRADKRSCEAKLVQFEALLEQNAELTEVANRSVQLDLLVKRIQAENENLSSQLSEHIRSITSQRNENSALRSEIEELRRENHLLTEKLADFDLLQKQADRSRALLQKVSDLELQNAALQRDLHRAEATQTMALASSKAQETLTEEIKQLQQQLDELNTVSAENDSLKHANSVLSERLESLEPFSSENEKLKLEVRQLQEEISEREKREQHLSVKYRFYKSKAKEQEVRRQAHEAELSEIKNQMMRLEERESMKEAALRRKRRHAKYSDAEKAKLIKDLEIERTRNVRMEAQLINAKRQLEFNCM